MFIKCIFITIFCLCVYTVNISAQCVDAPDDPCVPVHQSTLDKAKQIVDRLKAAEAVIVAFEKERTFTDAERKAWLGFKDAAEQTVAMLQKGIVDREKVITLQQTVIDKLMVLNDKLLAQLDKKPSFFKQLVSVLKTVVILAAGVTFGRGL